MNNINADAGLTLMPFIPERLTIIIAITLKMSTTQFAPQNKKIQKTLDKPHEKWYNNIRKRKRGIKKCSKKCLMRFLKM